MRQSKATRDQPDPGERLPWYVLLRALREAAGVTQEGWAARLGYGRRTIQRWERGELPPSGPAAEELVRLCSDLGLYRTFGRGMLADVVVTPAWLRGLLGEARFAAVPSTTRPSMTEEESGHEEGTPLFPSLGPRESPPDLPAELTSFIGRESMIAEVERLLPTTRLLTLVGVGGVGKTRLARRVALDLLDVYPEGVWLAELGAIREPGVVALVVARALRVREQPARAIADTLAEALHTRRLLLVLDNCEHLVAACAELADRLLRSAPYVRILATSRESLGIPGEIVWPVPPLPVPDERPDAPWELLGQAEAVRLFVERATAVRPGFSLTSGNARAVARICRHLDGLPLAIELAATRIRLLTPSEIATRLDDRFGLLVGGSRTAPERHRTLRGTVDWSYGLLDEAERRLFDRLSVFGGSFTIAAAEAVGAHDIADSSRVLDLLASLVGKSLVLSTVSDDASETRYCLLETLREYGREQLLARGEAVPVRRRYAGWLVERAEQAEREAHGPAYGAWLTWFGREIDNVRAVLGSAIDDADADVALRLAGAVAWYWFDGPNQSWAEARAWLERALTLPTTTRGTETRARALAGAALLATFAGDFRAARDRIDQSLAIAHEIGDDNGLLTARSHLALLLDFTGQFAVEADVVRETLGLARRLNAAWHQGRMLALQARLALRQDDAGAARTRLEESVGLARGSGDSWSLATALGDLGDVERVQGHYAQAGVLYLDSLALRDALGLAGAPSMEHNLGYVALAEGNGAAAREHFARALAQFYRQGDRRGVAECLIGLAGVRAAGGRAEAAACLFGAGEAELSELGSQLWPSNRADYARSVARARAVLDATSFEAAWTRGRRLSIDEAIGIALEP